MRIVTKAMLGLILVVIIVVSIQGGIDRMKRKVAEKQLQSEIEQLEISLKTLKKEKEVIKPEDHHFNLLLEDQRRERIARELRKAQERIAASQQKRINTEEPSCSDFKILSIRGVRGEFGMLRVKGEIKNVGSIAAGVQIEVIARDRNGVLIDSADFWPNSIYNIPPGETRGISYPITEDRNAIAIEAKIIRVRVW